eukprot:GHVT01059413.1.p1 GENE.GHVT01059413.1~~GHVT01059413.1.p1  ORF type:complete len:443 (+),score=51.25 GHVT01059413.1:140-1330(+)
MSRRAGVALLAICLGFGVVSAAGDTNVAAAGGAPDASPAPSDLPCVFPPVAAAAGTGGVSEGVAGAPGGGSSAASVASVDSNAATASPPGGRVSASSGGPPGAAAATPGAQFPEAAGASGSPGDCNSKMATGSETRAGAPAVHFQTGHLPPDFTIPHLDVDKEIQNIRRPLVADATRAKRNRKYLVNFLAQGALVSVAAIVGLFLIKDRFGPPPKEVSMDRWAALSQQYIGRVHYLRNVQDWKSMKKISYMLNLPIVWITTQANCPPCSKLKPVIDAMPTQYDAIFCNYVVTDKADPPVCDVYSPKAYISFYTAEGTWVDTNILGDHTEFASAVNSLCHRQSSIPQLVLTLTPEQIEDRMKTFDSERPEWEPPLRIIQQNEKNKALAEQAQAQTQK